MRNRILYWDGIIDLKGLSSEYHKVIQMLLAGEYRLLSLEKLRGHDVYSVRINDTHRMLFKTEEIDGRPMLVILDIVLNHDYHKSPFLKPAVLRNYLELNGQAFVDAVVTKEDFEKVAQPDVVCQSANSDEYEFAPAEYYKQRFIEFNDVQQQIVHVAKLPLVINGAAGSGKSCVALSLLSHYVLNHFEIETKPILYITQSQKLCDSMYRNWMSLPIAHHPQANLVVFKTYKQLISEHFPAGYHPKEVGRDEFIEYMKARLKTKAVRKSIANLSPEFIKQIEVMYQEMRITSGCKDLEHYRRLGKNQSLLKDKNERSWLFHEYQNYLHHLKHNNLIDFAFYTPELRGIFDLVVVDETQDLSNLQIASLYVMAANRQICFCEDMRQSLMDKLPKIYADILNAQESDVTFIKLKQSYRCPPAVLRMANGVSQLATRLVKQHFEPTVNDNANIDGNVVWHDALTEAELHAYLTQAQSPDFAVVTRAEFLEEARALFKTELVFTVDEIKGLEYRSVLVYRLLDETRYYEISDLIAEGIVARPGNEKHCPGLNGLYTALTRATENTYIVEDHPEACHKLQYLIEYLKRGLPAVAVVAKPAKVRTEEQTRELWFREARKLIDAGDRNRAKEIFVNRLGVTEEVFERDYPVSRIDEIVDEGWVVSERSTTTPAPEIKPGKPRRHTEEYYDIADLLANPTKAKLEKLFNSKRAIELLFDYTEDTESLFTALFDNPQIREIILENGILSNSYNRLGMAFNEKTVNRVNTYDKPNESQMPPIFWIVTHPKTLNELGGYPFFKLTITKLVTPQTMLTKLQHQGHGYRGLSVLYMLSCTGWGIDVLCDYYKSNSEEFRRKLSTSTLFVNVRRTNIFQNLMCTAKGQELFEKLADVRPAMFHYVSLYDLLMLDITKTNRILSLVLERKSGRQFIKTIQSKNSAFYEKDISKLNKQQIRELVAECIGSAEERALLEKFEMNIKDLTLNSLINLFANKNAVKYIFKMFLNDHEHLFTKLFDYPESRRWTLTTIFPTYIKMINANITAKMLARISTEEHMPPMFWLAGSETGGTMLCHWITDGRCLDISVDALLKGMDVTYYLRNINIPDEFNPFRNKTYVPAIKNNNEISAFQLLMLLSSGRNTLHVLISKKNVLPRLPLDIFSRRWITEVATKNVISTLLLLTKVLHGSLLITTILLLQNENHFITTDSLLDGLVIDEKNNLQGECALINLLNMDDDNEALLTILEESTRFDMKRILPIVLYAVMPNCNTIHAGGWLIKIFKDEEYAIRLLKIFERQPELISMLDKRAFLGDLSKLPFYQKFVFESLGANKHGRDLLKMIQDGLRKPHSPRLFEGDIVIPSDSEGPRHDTVQSNKALH